MNKRKVPKIRFKGFHDDWEQRKLGDIYGSIGNAFVGTATPYYVEQGHFYLESNNVKDGQINHNSEIFINDEFYETQKGKWLHTGDMVMVQSGHVGHAAVIPEELDNTAAHALIMFRNPKEKIEPYFLNYSYQTDKAKKIIENITTGNTIKHILASDMQEFVVDVPKYEEQKVIAGYFLNLDNLITLHQRKLEKLKIIKKSMLENCFPKNGEKVPKTRFSGFSDDWEQRKLIDLLDQPITDGPHETPNIVDDGIPFISADAIVDNKIDFTRKRGNITEEYDLQCCKKYKPEFHDVYLVKSGSTVGKVAIAETTQRFNIWSPLAAMRCKENSDPYFLFALLQTKENQAQVKDKASNGTQPNLSMRALEQFDIVSPCSRNEQIKIGEFFNNLDNLITLHQSKLEKLKMIKKSMLETMFV